MSVAIAGALALVAIAAAPPVPSRLAALLANAHVNGSVVAWCRGEFQPGRRDAFAVAVVSASGGGRYLVVDADGVVAELSLFAGSADLSCYSRAEAAKLDVTIRRSATIHGHVAPRWQTTIVCGFTDDTTAVCWQYSPADRTFVKVGGWQT